MNLRHNQNNFDLRLKTDKDTKKLSVNGSDVDVSYRKLSENAYLVFIGGRKYVAYAAMDANYIYVNIDGTSYTFDKVKDEEKSFDSASGANENMISVRPPMPGSIVKVLAEKGMKVAEGDGLVIVEAMKMETTLYSTIDGIVTGVNVAEGEQVDSDKILVVVEKVS